jgi:AraC-like DNA-binding protein
MRTLYFKTHLAKDLPHNCCVVNVPALLKELIVHACQFCSLKKTVKRECHLIDVIIDQLCGIQVVPLQLPHPSDPRAVHIAEALLADPSDRRTLLQRCQRAGASKRTLERVFQRDVGMSLGKLAPTITAHACHAPPGGRSESDACGARRRIRHAKRIHFDAQESFGNDTNSIFQSNYQTWLTQQRAYWVEKRAAFGS